MEDILLGGGYSLKKKIALLVLFLFALSIVSSYSYGLVKVYVNGVKQRVTPYIKDGVVYLPANAMAMALGITISWSGTNRILKINNKVVSSSPLIVDGKLYLPVESIASESGATVVWDGKSNAVRISKSGSLAVGISSSKPEVSNVSKVSSKPHTNYYAKPTKQKTKPAYIPSISTPAVGIHYQNASSYKSKPKYSSSTSSGSGIYVPKPPPVYGGQPTKSAYPDSGINRDAPLQPKDAPPRMPSNLSLPPMYTQNAVSSPDETFASSSPFIPKSEANDIFRVTVTNVEFVNAIKDYYKPKPGYRFVVVYLSQQNISDEVQIYTGRFSLLDQNNNSYDYIEGLSNFWLIILRPGGINFGYLVFEIPSDAKPMYLVLHGLNRSPLSVALR